MASKTVQLAGVGDITLVKRAQSRSLRLTVTPGGVRVSMPRWTPYGAGEAFARKHLDWIQAELAKQTTPHLAAGQTIGKLHRLRFEQVPSSQAATARVTATEVIVRLHPGETSADAIVQERAGKACIRALRREAERLLPPRLNALSEKHGRPYASVAIKQLKRRWGSCDSKRNIALNLFLMELPWEQIDYVLLHELAHTVEMNHSEAFWHELTAMQPRARDIARAVRRHQPALGTG